MDLEEAPTCSLVYRKVLLALSALFTLQGFSWMWMGSFDPFGIYNGLLAQHLWNTEVMPAAAEDAFAFAMIPFGATDGAMFLMMFLVIWHGFPAKLMWSWNVIGVGFLVWFLTDTAMCALHGAWFNILIVNLPCFVLYGTPLLLARREFQDT